MTLDVMIGRALAFCVHPFAAWTRLSGGGRALLVGAYAAASYALVLGALIAL